MFFLYVLKEERGCPVSEVFEDYIKPMSTRRFQSDFADDYAKMLERIKMAQRNEKIYNVALKKLKRRQYRKDYQSDSCIPTETDPFNDFSGLSTKK